MRTSLSLAIALTFACSLVAPAAQASYVQLKAERETHGTDCTWSRNEHKVRLESYFPVISGDNAALIITPKEVLPDNNSVEGVVLSACSFKVVQVQNVVFKNVHPGVNIEYDDAGKEHQILNLGWTELNNINNGPAVSFVAKFGHPVKVRHIVIGGHELSSDGVGALDLHLLDFKVYDPNFKELERRFDNDVKVVSAGSDPLLKNLKCSYLKR